MTETKHRLATEDDIPVLCDLLGILFTQEAEFSPDRTRQERALRAILGNPAIGEILIAEALGNVVAMVSLLYSESTFLGGKVAILEDMVVHPEFRGRGIGAALLRAAIDHAQLTGCLRITLLTDSTNERAIRFYEKPGFRPSAMLPMRLTFPS